MKKLILTLLSYRQVEAVKTGIACFLYYSGLAYVLSLFTSRGASILLYHSVNDEGVFWDNIVTPENFERQISFLVRERRIVPLARIVEKLLKRENIPPDWVAITFDDGYLDNVERALPILEAKKAPASFFPTVDVIGGKMSLFYDAVQMILDETARQEIRLDLEGRPMTFSLHSKRKREDAVLRIVLAIRKKPETERWKTVEQLENVCGFSAAHLRDALYMREDHLNMLVSSGMEVGSHTLTHPDLTGLPHEVQEEELSSSRRILEELTRSEVRGLAYPFGKRRHFNEEIKRSLKAAGYVYALTTVFGKVSKDTDPYALPRMGVRNACLARLKVNLMGIRI